MQANELNKQFINNHQFYNGNLIARTKFRSVQTRKIVKIIFLNT